MLSLFRIHARRLTIAGLIAGLILAAGVAVFAEVFQWVGIPDKPNRGEKLRVVGQAIFGRYGAIPGVVTLMPPDGTGFYHIDNPGGQRIRISGGSYAGQFEYMTVGHPGQVTIRGDLYVTGRKSFIHDHPDDASKKIIYVSLEGPEAGTYIRGTAQLDNGSALIDLPQHFSWVTNENGITVQLTCLDECNGLRVAHKNTRQITVKELLGGHSNAKFDYLVHGVRRDFSNSRVIQNK